MKQLLLSTVALVTVFQACKTGNNAGMFVVNGEMKNLRDQKVYLEQVFFNGQPPQLLDSAESRNGVFDLRTKANEEGFYRIRMNANQASFLFVNDLPVIKFTADANDRSLTGPTFQTPGNDEIKKFIVQIDESRAGFLSAQNKLDSLPPGPLHDSLATVYRNDLKQTTDEFNGFIHRTIDNTKSPVLAMIALGYTKASDSAYLGKTLPALVKKFPGNTGLESMNKNYQNYLQAAAAKQQAPAASNKIGTLAPDFTMNGTDGKPFTLSSLRGKYVLVDFWASWCGPCRMENPNVVAAFNKFKDRNFTVLGVSLDENKTAWEAAIKKDNLAWKHVSDLKGWDNATVGMYGYEGIPYNVLLDPQGKIIAAELRGGDLENKLAEVLK